MKDKKVKNEIERKKDVEKIKMEDEIVEMNIKGKIK